MMATSHCIVCGKPLTSAGCLNPTCPVAKPTTTIPPAPTGGKGGKQTGAGCCPVSPAATVAPATDEMAAVIGGMFGVAQKMKAERESPAPSLPLAELEELCDKLERAEWKGDFELMTESRDALQQRVRELEAKDK